MNESALQREIRLELGQMPGIVLWRNHTGAGYVVETKHCPHCRRELDARYQRFGLCLGSADLIGIRREQMEQTFGRFVALEVKGPRGRLSSEQKMFLALVHNAGGIAGHVRSVTEARQILGA